MPTQKNSQEVRNQKLNWKEDLAQAQKMPDILPYVQLEVNGETNLEILQDEPYQAEYKDKKTGKMRFFPAIKVRENGHEKILGLSAKSLRLALAKIFDKVGTLKDQKIILRKITYEHAEWGKDTKGYRVEHLTE